MNKKSSVLAVIALASFVFSCKDTKEEEVSVETKNEVPAETSSETPEAESGTSIKVNKDGVEFSDKETKIEITKDGGELKKSN